MNKNILLMTVAFGVCNISLEESALADQTFHDTIPASACQLQNEDDIGKADLVDGSWLISASTTNTDVELICPVRSAPFFVVGVTKTETVWGHMEIFYRDPDGTSNSHRVIAKLFEIEKTDTTANELDSISSNSNLSNTTTDTRHDEALDVLGNELVDAQHFVQITMHQGSNNGTDRVRFSRVRLWPLPPGF